jgi:hypothetical protein
MVSQTIIATQPDNGANCLRPVIDGDPEQRIPKANCETKVRGRFLFLNDRINTCLLHSGDRSRKQGDGAGFFFALAFLERNVGLSPNSRRLGASTSRRAQRS